MGLPSHWPLSVKLSGTRSADADLLLEHWPGEGRGFPGLGSGSLRDVLLGSIVPAPMGDLCLKAVPKLAWVLCLEHSQAMLVLIPCPSKTHV